MELSRPVCEKCVWELAHNKDGMITIYSDKLQEFTCPVVSMEFSVERSQPVSYMRESDYPVLINMGKEHINFSYKIEGKYGVPPGCIRLFEQAVANSMEIGHDENRRTEEAGEGSI
jgi:hypothetical protein